MTEAELFPFLAVFRSVLQVFPKRLDEHELSQMGGSYFKAMRRFQLSQVTAGADVWTQRGKFFPKPAEWIDSIPKATAHRPDVVELTSAEILEYEDAERQHYEGEPCRCLDCRAAGVDHRFLRFVPDFDADGHDVKGKIGDRIVVRGHWIHGSELASFYMNREAFWSLFNEHIGKRVLTLQTDEAARCVHG